MKKLVYIQSMTKGPSRGVFWIIDRELFAYPFIDDFNEGTAKSGNTYNHKLLWPHVKPTGCNKPYNYYPRGRVDITNSGKFRIYINPSIDESLIPEIKVEFGIREDPKVIYDYSEHYKCYLDEGWEPDY